MQGAVHSLVCTQLGVCCKLQLCYALKVSRESCRKCALLAPVNGSAPVTVSTHVSTSTHLSASTPVTEEDRNCEHTCQCKH
eukprot:scaffold183777_cov19-Tisochrysis_lutea.AAC.2